MSDDEASMERDVRHIDTSVTGSNGGVQDLLTDTSQWSMEDKEKLLNAVESFLKWEYIKVDGKSEEECKAMYRQLIGKGNMSAKRGRGRPKKRLVQDVADDLQMGVSDVGHLVNDQEAFQKLSNAKAVNRLKQKYKQPTHKKKLKKINTASRRQRHQYPDMPKRPSTSFCLFVNKMSKKSPEVKSTEKMKVFAKDWEKLPEKKKEKYKKKYARRWKKYKEDMETFIQNHPECQLPVVKSASCPKPPLPSRLYVESRTEKTKSKHPELSNGEVVKRLKDKYEKLSDKRKLKWIRKAIRARQTYQDEVKIYLADNPTSTRKPALFTLSKEEDRIWHSSWGKFVCAPPKSVNMFFWNTKRDALSHLNSQERNRELSILYRRLNKEEVTDLQEAFIKEVKEYVQEYTSYYSSLPDEKRSEEIAPEEVLAAYNTILQKPQTQKKNKAKRRTVGVHDANNNKAKQSDPPNADSDEDIDTILPQKRQIKTNKKAKRRTAGVHEANNNKAKQSNPPRSNAEADGDIDDPHRPNAESDGDFDDPPRPNAESDGDFDDPPRPNAESDGDFDDPPRPNTESDGDFDEQPRPNAESDGDIDDPQPSSQTVSPAKRKKKRQLDRKATQKKTKLDTTSQNPIVPAQNNTLDQDAQLSMPTPQRSNAQVGGWHLRVRSPQPSTPSSESWLESHLLAREMEIARRPPGFSGRGQSN